MRYTLVISAPQPGESQVSPEAMAEMQGLMTDYASALHAAGVLVAAEMLQPDVTATTVTRRSGSVEIQDGPFADTKEALAGVFVLDVPDLDAALAWAEKHPVTAYGTVEVRPSAVSVIDGTWVPAN